MEKRRMLMEIGFRLKEVRRALRASQDKMGEIFGVGRTTYAKNENGETFPNTRAYYTLATRYGISLDWLICNKDQMFYKERNKEEEKKEEKEAMELKQAKETGEEVKAAADLPEEVKELLEYMERVPLLHHQVMAFYHRFRFENKELVQACLDKVESEETG